MIRLGLCCAFRNQPIKFANTTATAIGNMTRPDALAKLSRLCLENADASLAALQFCADNGIGCFRVSAISAIPALFAAAWLAARAFPMRPGVAGALYGLGCGLIADAGLRLYCEYTVPEHVLLGHGGAILGAMALGAIVSKIIPRS